MINALRRLQRSRAKIPAAAARRPFADEFREVRRALEERPRQQILVCGGDDAEVLADLFRARWPKRGVVVTPGGTQSLAEHTRLTAAGPFAVVVDLSSPAEQPTTFLRTFPLLRRDATYVASVPEDAGTEGLPSLLAQLEAVRDGAEEETAGAPRGLAAAVSGWERRDGLVVATTGRRFRSKIRESQVGNLLASRPDLGRVVAELPATTLVSRCEYHDNASTPDPRIRPEYAVPIHQLRTYHRPTCRRGQIVESHGVLLPDTYRHFPATRTTNTYVDEVLPDFATPKRLGGTPVDLPGAYFYLDSEWPGHYGHLMTEQISRLWAYDRARELEPDLKVLLTLQRGRKPQELLPFEVDILGAMGIEPRDVHVFDAPVRPERLYAATPMLSGSYYVNPAITEVWDRIGRGLLEHAEERERPRRIFCSRRPTLKRSCRNADEVERLFAEYGFEVIFPEEHSVPEQTALFRAADVVAGFAGSALFTLAFCDEPKKGIIISPEAYTARNEFFIAAARGHSLDVIWSRSEIEHPDGGWSAAAFGSGFTFDLDAEGADLRKVLDAL
ncbi:glycosyltransferase family 61 protein [Mumia quercus]|uniref:glycosyltransferase family 61 protein n=1 Tax=Mumia quercus TaxID=2976125 RepID=UPI0021D04DA0|nr:glycosyltransferase family 61 protein [Mumia quercus]